MNTDISMQADASGSALGVRLWGTRGSIPTPLAANMGHGGNTACVQVLAPGIAETIILDAGSGIHQLGRDMARELAHAPHTPQTLRILFSHFHWDHLQGLPGFAPLFLPHDTLHFYSTRPARELETILHGQMIAPYFPVDFETLLSTRTFNPVPAEGLIFGDVHITPFALHHPGGSTGYRIRRGSKTIIYATDHEHGDTAADQRLLDAATGADILIVDAQYTPEQLPAHKGWGHSSWLQATHLAKAAGVKQLVLFHHDPHHDDHTLVHIAAQAREHFPAITMAIEGATLFA